MPKSVLRVAAEFERTVAALVGHDGGLGQDRGVDELGHAFQQLQLAPLGHARRFQTVVFPEAFALLEEAILQIVVGSLQRMEEGCL